MSTTICGGMISFSRNTAEMNRIDPDLCSPPPEVVNEGAAAIVEYLKEMFQVNSDPEIG